MLTRGVAYRLHQRGHQQEKLALHMTTQALTAAERKTVTSHAGYRHKMAAQCAYTMLCSPWQTCEKLCCHFPHCCTTCAAWVHERPCMQGGEIIRMKCA